MQRKTNYLQVGVSNMEFNCNQSFVCLLVEAKIMLAYVLGVFLF